MERIVCLPSLTASYRPCPVSLRGSRWLRCSSPPRLVLIQSEKASCSSVLTEWVVPGDRSGHGGQWITTALFTQKHFLPLTCCILTDQFDKLHFCVVATRHTGIRLLLLRRVQAAETLHAECCCRSNKQPLTTMGHRGMSCLGRVIFKINLSASD